MLIPDNELPIWPQLAVNGEKEGGLWFVDRNSPGKHDTSQDTNCSPTQQQMDQNVQVYWAGTGGKNNGPPFHTSPAFWENNLVDASTNYIYITQQQLTKTGPVGPLTRYPLCATSIKPIDFTSCPGAAPVKAVDASNAVLNFGWGATPSISANGELAVQGIVWAISKPDLDTAEGTTPGILYAIDASSMTQLYSSATCSSGVDQINAATKYSVPTVANNYVYVGTQSANTNQQNLGLGTFYIFGLGRTGC